MARSTTISSWCPPPGTARRAMRNYSARRLRSRLSARRWRTSNSRSRSCAPSTPLTRALPAPYIFTIRRGGTSTKCPSSETMSTVSSSLKGKIRNGWHNGWGSHPTDYRRVYVWELPVRAYHWINAITLTLLIVTGYLIGAPIRAFAAVEAYQQYWFGWIRFIHFASAYIYAFNFLARIYWGFVGNKYAKWNN